MAGSKRLHRISRQLRIGLLPTLVLAVVVFAGACGDDDGGVTAPTSAPSTTASSSSTTIASTSTESTAPGSSTTESTAPEGEAACSAALLDLTLPAQPELPQAVAATREEIFAAATACDYQKLEESASGGDLDFTFSFGDPEGGPAAYWQAAEERGEPVIATLARILTMPYAEIDGQYAWPFAHGLDFQVLTPEQEQMLRQHFSESEIAEWERAGSYLGYRAGISAEGEWLYFVAGD